MTTEQNGIRTGVGRMVQGDPFEAQTKNKEGKPLVNAAGEPRVQYFFGIAIPKTCPEWMGLLAKMQGVAQAGFPGGQHALQTFAWKYVDGDLPEHAGKDGFPGHWVLRCAGGFAPKVYKLIEGTADFAQVVDPNELKRGYYIKAFLNIKSNDSTTKPGIYLNPVAIQIIQEGPVIQTGPDAATMFGGAAAVPVNNAAVINPPIVNAPAATVVPPVINAPAIPAAITAPVIPTPIVPIAAPVKTMTAKANGATYEAFIAQGWTDERMVSEGYMLSTAPGVQQNTQVLA